MTYIANITGKSNIHKLDKIIVMYMYMKLIEAVE